MESNNDIHSLAAVIREIRIGLTHVVKSDITLAKTELREASGKLKKDVAQLAVFGVLALLGIPPFLAFLVIGLGDALGGNYWLSALLVSVTFLAVGGIMALGAIKKLKSHDLTFPHTRRAVDHEIALVDRKLHQIADNAKRRSA